MGSLFSMALPKKDVHEIIQTDFYNLTQEEIRNEIKNDGLMVRYLINPTEDDLIVAVEQNPASIKFIIDPPRSVQLIVAKKDHTHLKYCKKVHFDAVKVIVKDHPEYIRLIRYKSQYLSELIAINPRCIQYCWIQYDSLQMEAVKLDIKMIMYINYPTEDVQKFVLMKDPELAKYVRNPDKKILNLIKNL